MRSLTLSAGGQAEVLGVLLHEPPDHVDLLHTHRDGVHPLALARHVGRPELTTRHIWSDFKLREA